MCATNSGCENITSITIPNAVTSIGTYAFKGCKSLTGISIPNAVKSIDGYAFQNCSNITKITFGDGITSIGNYAFNGCSKLTIYDFGNTRTVIPALSNTNAFMSTSNSKKIIVPDSLYDTWITKTNWSSTTNNIKTSIIKYTDYYGS